MPLNVEILNLFDPQLQLSKARSVIKNKLKDFLILMNCSLRVQESI